MKIYPVQIAVFGLSSIVLAACRDAEWAARADIAQAQAVSAQANSAALQAQAKSAADIAGSQAGNINTALWAAALPGILLLLVVAAIVIVGAVVWGSIQRDRIRAQVERDRYMMQLMLLDNGAPTRRLPVAPAYPQLSRLTTQISYPPPKQIADDMPLLLPDPRWLERL